MPSSNSRLRANSSMDRISHVKPVTKRLPILNDKVSCTRRTENPCANVMKDMDKELKNLAEDIQKAKEKHEELLSSKEVVIKNMDAKMAEKGIFLKECQEMKPDLFKWGVKEEIIPLCEDEKYILPFQFEDARKPSTLYEKVMKEYIKLRNANYEYTVHLIDEISKNKRLGETLEIVQKVKDKKGRVYFLNKIKELESEITETNSAAEEIVKKTKASIGNCWERAANIYGPKMRELMEKKGNLENEFLDKEEKLKELHANEAFLDNEIAARKSKLERQTEINRLKSIDFLCFQTLVFSIMFSSKC